MKLRTGFVSNSSSSSFVVAGAVDALKNGKIQIEVDITKFGDVIRSIKELDDYFIGQHLYVREGEDPQKELIAFFEDETYFADQYQEMSKAILAGKAVVAGRCSDDSGNSTETYLCDNGFEGLFGDDVDVIDGGGGY